MLLLLGHTFPFQFGVSGVIIPKKPPCFAIPFFEPYWYSHRGTTEVPREVHIQDVCNSEIRTFTKVRIDQNVKTIPARYITHLLLESGSYEISAEYGDTEGIPVFLTSLDRLYAYAESFKRVHFGHLEPLRVRLAQHAKVEESKMPINDSIENDGVHFTSLEVARFRRDRSMCINALTACFGSLQQHNRGLAVFWLQMTKESLKQDGILESSD